MKKSTIIMIVALVLGIIILSSGFILLTDNNISKRIFGAFENRDTTTTTTTPTTIPTTTTKPPRVEYQPMDLFNTDISEYVTLGDYKNLSIEVDQLKATEEDVDWQIDIILAMQQEFTKERSGQISEKTIFSFDFTGYHIKEDGTKDKAFDGGAGTDQLAYIEDGVLYTISSQGIGSFIDGFAEGMLGKSVGDKLDLDITFPEDYHAAALKGKKTIFEVEIKYIATPNFSDGWVKEATKGEYSTCDEYRDYIEDAINEMIEESNMVLLWEKIMDNAIVEIPKQQFDYVYYTQRYQIEDYAAMFSMSYEDFLKSGYAAYIGVEATTDEELRNFVTEGLTYELVMMAIIQAEDIKATDEEYRIMLDSLIEQTGKTEAEVLEKYPEDFIRQQLVLQKIDDEVRNMNSFVLKIED